MKTYPFSAFFILFSLLLLSTYIRSGWICKVPTRGPDVFEGKRSPDAAMLSPLPRERSFDFVVFRGVARERAAHFSLPLCSFLLLTLTQRDSTKRHMRNSYVGLQPLVYHDATFDELALSPTACCSLG